MRKRWWILLAILIAACICCSTIFYFCLLIRDDFSYSVSDGEVTLTKCKKTISEAIIPEEVNGLPVTRIGDHAFQNCTKLTSISLPQSLTSIGKEAFSGCGNLQKIAIPSKVKTIEEKAFFDCKKIKRVSTPDLANWCSIDFADSYANPMCYKAALFVNGKVPKELVLSDDVSFIGDYVFTGCSAPTEIYILNEEISLNKNAFEGCPKLTVYFAGDKEKWASAGGSLNTKTIRFLP